jgi:hypothetical protein
MYNPCLSFFLQVSPRALQADCPRTKTRAPQIVCWLRAGRLEHATSVVPARRLLSRDVMQQGRRRRVAAAAARRDTTTVPAEEIPIPVGVRPTHGRQHGAGEGWVKVSAGAESERPATRGGEHPRRGTVAVRAWPSRARPWRGSALGGVDHRMEEGTTSISSRGPPPPPLPSPCAKRPTAAAPASSRAQGRAHATRAPPCLHRPATLLKAAYRAAPPPLIRYRSRGRGWISAGARPAQPDPPP